jgi:hypothetical protein
MTQTWIERLKITAVLALMAAGLLLVVSTPSAEAAKQFAKKECLDCHKKFEDTYLSEEGREPALLWLPFQGGHQAEPAGGPHPPQAGEVLLLP